MPRYLKIRIVILFLCLAGPCAAFGQDSRSVRLVEITSTRSQIYGARPQTRNASPSPDANPDQTELTIRKEGDGYILNGQAVDPNLIKSLVSALTAPTNPEPNLDDLGITPAWLKGHAASVAQRVSETTLIGREHVPQAALESTFADPVIMDKIVPELFDRRHYACVDCAHHRFEVRVTVTFDDSSNLSAFASSEFPFMLPWHLSNATAYNAGISRAVAALMPDNSANRSLLLAEKLDMQLGHAAVWQARNLDVERRTGGTFEALRTKCTVITASIGDYSDPVLRRPEQPSSENPSVLFQLRRSDTPDIFFDDELVLPYADGSAVGADAFLQRAPQYEQLVLSVPWLNQFVQQNKRIVRPRLAFSHGMSFSDAAEQAFSEDMHAIGQDKSIVKAEAAKDQIALLTVGFGAEESDWLVFPDRHMLLWRYFQVPIYGKPDLLKWQPAAFPRKPCAKIKNNFVGCVGVEVSPDGALIPPEQGSSAIPPSPASPTSQVAPLVKSRLVSTPQP
jgi:hypothetical protein